MRLLGTDSDGEKKFSFVNIKQFRRYLHASIGGSVLWSSNRPNSPTYRAGTRLFRCYREERRRLTSCRAECCLISTYHIGCSVVSLQANYRAHCAGWRAWQVFQKILCMSFFLLSRLLLLLVGVRACMYGIVRSI